MLQVSNAFELRRFDRTQPDTLVAEASDLGISRPTGYITIRSHHTNRFCEFSIEKIDKDREGDVAGWWFIPLDDNHPIKHVLIIND